jgi:sterol desaturase/sphingolipid hydroxylase (fatty acid hydroxylase superfamily)
MSDHYITLFSSHFLVTVSALKPWLPLLAAAIAVELFVPGKKLRLSELGLNLVYLPLALVLGGMFIFPTIAKLNTVMPRDMLGLGHLIDSPWGTAVLWLLYLVFFDFLYYWFHRAQHYFPVLWRFHMVHHSDENTSSTSVGRHHWTEEAWRYFIITAPLTALLGHPESTPFLVLAWIITNGIFMHWNVPFRFGVLEKLAITPAYHRIHHSIEAPHFDKNFGVFTQLWDWVFKTRFLPAQGVFPQTGLTDLPQRNAWALLLPWPIILRRK